MTPGAVLACASCFAQNVDSPLVDGAKSGVWLLLGVTVGVQGAFAAFFIRLWRRARRVRNAELETEWAELQRSTVKP